MSGIWGIREVCGLAVFGALIAGCQDGPTSGAPVAGCPDGKVEYLTVAESGRIRHTDGAFLELVDRQDQKLIIVDFWATWCGPCLKMAPHLETIKKDWGDRIEIVKVDVDKSPHIANHLQVLAYPTVRIFRGGIQVADFVGYRPREEIESLLKSLQ